jgi:class 3 adenylate cyclase
MRDGSLAARIRRVRGATKTATVMFTDLVGSTELASRLGTGASTRLRELHFAALRDSLSVHRGTEVKTLGDGASTGWSRAYASGSRCASTTRS